MCISAMDWGQAMRFAKWTALSLSGLLVLLWLLSQFVFISIPVGQSRAVAVGEGSFRYQSVFPPAGGSLTATLRWAWNGFTLGRVGWGITGWRPLSVYVLYQPILPVALLVGVPGAFLWSRERSVISPPVCQECGRPAPSRNDQRCPHCGGALAACAVRWPRLPTWLAATLAALCSPLFLILAILAFLSVFDALLLLPNVLVIILAFLFFLVLAYPPVRMIYDVLRWRVVRDLGARCLKCGYDLTGNVSGRCPECGEETQT